MTYDNKQTSVPRWRVGQQFELTATVVKIAGYNYNTVPVYRLTLTDGADICLPESELERHRALPMPLAVGDRVKHAYVCGNILAIHDDFAWVKYDTMTGPLSIRLSALCAE